MNYLTAADCFDALSVALLSAVTTSQVLDIIYLVLLSASLVMGIVMKLIIALRDKHLDDDEIKEIKKEVDDAAGQIKDLIDDKDRKENK